MENRTSLRKFSPILLVPFAWVLYFVALFPRMIFMRPDGLYLGHENLWSDWSLHIALARIFADKAPSDWFAYHPLYADGKLTYAFLTNLISGMLMRFGMEVPAAFVLPSLLFSFALVAGMFLLARVLLRSAAQASLAISLFFLSSGLGFIDYLREGRIVPSREFSKLNDFGWGSGNFLIGHLIPQRAFLLGMALTVFSMFVFFDVLEKEQRRVPLARRTYVLLGLAALATGILPVAHMHSLIALVLMLGPYAIYLAIRRIRSAVWLGFALPSGVLSGILFWIFVHGKIENPAFMSWHPGYTAGSFLDWLRFWWLAWGPMLPLVAAALVGLRKGLSIHLRAFSYGAILLFGAANLWWFQPLSWDNSKLFLWVYFIFSMVSAAAISAFWKRGLAWRGLAVALVVTLCATGVIEAVYLQRVEAHTFRLLDADNLALAERVRAKTAPRERFLTAFDHNTWAMVWAGRPIIMGYEGWVLNFGLNYGATKKKVEQIYRGGPLALDLLASLKVSYVVVGPSERQNLNANEEFFRMGFPLLDSNPESSVYDVRAAVNAVLLKERHCQEQ